VSAGHRLKALKQEADEQLLVEAAKRDPARFADLYERNFYQVYAYVARRVGSREEAEDLTSEVFHNALANLQGFEWRGAPFAAWLIRIAAHAMADRWRRKARETGNPVADEPKDLSMEGIEQRAALFQLVEDLPQDQRRVVLLRFVEQKSVKEIAQELSRSEGAVKQLQFRALEKLRASLEGANG
jgi:RNA polymerase sigma-70 factor, ECF subfamily